MPLIGWNGALDVHVQVIDDDHQKILRMINDLYDSLAAGSDSNLLGRLYDELVEYAETHLIREEKLFCATAYPDADKHKAEHARMLAWARNARARFLEQRQPDSSAELLTYLKEWLFHHIGGVDRRMAPYLLQAAAADKSAL